MTKYRVVLPSSDTELTVRCILVLEVVAPGSDRGTILDDHVSEIQSLNLDILPSTIATLVVAALSAIVPPPPARTARPHQCIIFDLCYSSRLQVPSFLPSLPFSTIDETRLKEFILMVGEIHFDITFDPLGKIGFAFVNAVEVFSAPIDGVWCQALKSSRCKNLFI
ncbi:hypothetical protein L1887_24279 [Cichorium endivia]|nr:hypothetical protein L1887_24279 [Cichorium endivia]